MTDLFRSECIEIASDVVGLVSSAKRATSDVVALAIRSSVSSITRDLPRLR